MKKIITLAFCMGIYATSFAQYNHGNYNENRNDRNATTFGRGYDNQRNFFSERDRNFEIARINREFKMKVYSIRHSRYMRHHQKKLAIRSAEYERARQIQMVNARFYNQFHYGYGRR
ncbi:MAG TPA: hypothetical protein VFI29_21855 [Hanamia sp.]|nr:hypothetical protein [Hanamia sp.]